MFRDVCAWQVVCISWRWWILFFTVWRNTVFLFRLHSKIVRRFRKRKSIVMRPRPNCWWYIRVHKRWFFLHGYPILNREHHKGITVSTVIARHPPNHGHSRRHKTSFSIHPRIEFGWTRTAAHVWCSFFVLVPYLTGEIQEICLFYIWSNRTLPWGKCHLSANIAEVIRVIYTLPGHFYKYTTQSTTIECQLKLLLHSSHERTWGHHLQYDRFRTTLNKNWRELTGNNSTDQATNTCSDDSRSRNFIVVWELQRPLRVLPTFEDGELIFSWKMWNFSP